MSRQADREDLLVRVQQALSTAEYQLAEKERELTSTVKSLEETQRVLRETDGTLSLTRKEVVRLNVLLGAAEKELALTREALKLANDNNALREKQIRDGDLMHARDAQLFAVAPNMYAHLLHRGFLDGQTVLVGARA